MQDRPFQKTLIDMGFEVTMDEFIKLNNPLFEHSFDNDGRMIRHRYEFFSRYVELMRQIMILQDDVLKDTPAASPQAVTGSRGNWKRS